MNTLEVRPTYKLPTWVLPQTDSVLPGDVPVFGDDQFGIWLAQVL